MRKRLSYAIDGEIVCEKLASHQKPQKQMLQIFILVRTIL